MKKLRSNYEKQIKKFGGIIVVGESGLYFIRSHYKFGILQVLFSCFMRLSTFNAISLSMLLSRPYMCCL
jgi:hypothetical protein